VLISVRADKVAIATFTSGCRMALLGKVLIGQLFIVLAVLQIQMAEITQIA
jgi:hypothetical protein